MKVLILKGGQTFLLEFVNKIFLDEAFTVCSAGIIEPQPSQWTEGRSEGSHARPWEGWEGERWGRQPGRWISGHWRLQCGGERRRI